jgi:hypothetical protein
MDVLDYAKRGWYVFPIAPNAKYPIAGILWKEQSSNDPEVVELWKDMYPGCNWAVDCGRSGLAVVDDDTTRPGREQDREAFLASIGELPKSMTVQTPSGGTHTYYEGKCQSRNNSLGNGVDTKGVGGYVLIPGSSIGGIPYTLVDASPVAAAPSFMPLPSIKQETCGPDDSTAHEGSEIDVLRYLDYLKTQDPLMEGGRDSGVYHLACKGRDFGLSESTVVKLITEYVVIDGEFSPAQIRNSASHAYKYAKGALGSQSVEAMFPEDEPDEAEMPAKPDDGYIPIEIIDVYDLFQTPLYALDWLIPNRCCRGDVDVLTAAGGMSKSSLDLLESIAIATGEPLAGYEIEESGPVWVINGEDATNIMYRRLHALFTLYGIKPEELAGKLRVSSNKSNRWTFLTQEGHNVKIDHKRVDEIMREIEKGKYVRLSIDPLVQFHCADENSNVAMDKLMGVFTRICDATNVSIGIKHHTRKFKQDEDTIGDSDLARGASSVIGASRIAYTLQGMPKNPKAREPWAKDLDIRQVWKYVRLDSAKGTNCSPNDETIWFTRESIGVPSIKKATGERRMESVGALARFTDMAAVQLAAEQGSLDEPIREDVIDFLDLIVEAIEVGGGRVSKRWITHEHIRGYRATTKRKLWDEALAHFEERGIVVRDGSYELL